MSGAKSCWSSTAEKGGYVVHWVCAALARLWNILPLRVAGLFLPFPDDG